MRQINRVAVLGSGVMGATIAAHLANAGLEVVLLDIVPKQLTAEEEGQGLSLESPAVRNRLADQALRGLARMKPAPLYLSEYQQRISTGNLSDDLDRLSSCDWVIEVVIENLSIKQDLFTRLAPHLQADTILSTNTSGLSVNTMAEALPDNLRRNFLVTHFFNPPRYMRLLEIVPTQHTDPAVVKEMSRFISRRLGKGIVQAKDTPNFIANRIGVFSIFNAIRHMLDLEMTVEEVDSVSGPATARPKSAVFRTADLVGIDTLAHICRNTYELLPDDECRETFKVPEFMERMLDENLLGNKSRKGFYKKEQRDGQRKIDYYDYQSAAFKPTAKPKFASVAAVKMIDDPATRIKTVVAGQDTAAEFTWRSLRDTLLYALNRIPEIADDILSIDNAMKWGFNWEIGPFEMFDAIGIDPFIRRLEKDGLNVPESLRGLSSFYRYTAEGRQEFYDLGKQEYRPVALKPGQIKLDILRRAGKVIDKNAGCSVIDLGDGVFNLEFHSKMNAISGDILQMVPKAIQRAESQGVGLVIGNQGANFSVGANLMLLAVALAEGAYEDVDLMVRSFQKATMAIKYARVPVVAAPFGMTLGGGCEFALHADAINAAAETYMGLVEIGVGLIPAGGGTKEMCLRAVEQAQLFDTDVSPFIFKYFRQLGMASVSVGAAELQPMGYLRRGDSITMDPDRLLADAKQKVLALAANYRPQMPVKSLPAPGRSIAASIRSQLWNLRMGNQITAYEEYLGGLIAQVITGGDVPAGTLISEDFLLQLEREAFLKACGQKKTAERVQHMLKKGKPLRN